MRPDDYLALLVCADLLTRLHQENEAQEMHKHMEEIKKIRTSEEPLFSAQSEPFSSEHLQEAQEMVSLEVLFQNQPSETANASEAPVTLEEHLQFEDGDLYNFTLLEEGADFMDLSEPAEESSEPDPYYAPLSKGFVMAEPPAEILKDQIAAFQESQKSLMLQYVERSQKRPHLLADLLHLFSGWAPKQSDQLLTDLDRKSTAGFFVHWKGRGIVVNPGPQFLHYFHQQGYFINDIDDVIVTRAAPQAYANVEAIYDLNYRHNSASGNGHLIRYFLHQAAYRRLAPLLKPQFKQERNTVHCLARYIDSADVERLQLAEGISLSYLYPIQEASGAGMIAL